MGSVGKMGSSLQKEDSLRKRDTGGGAEILEMELTVSPV